MKKIAININFKGTDYLSNYVECNEKQKEQFEELLKEAAKGKLSYLQFESVNKLLFFPADIIKQSILSIVYSN